MSITSIDEKTLVISKNVEKHKEKRGVLLMQESYINNSHVNRKQWLEPSV